MATCTHRQIALNLVERAGHLQLVPPWDSVVGRYEENPPAGTLGVFNSEQTASGLMPNRSGWKRRVRMHLRYSGMSLMLRR